MTKSLTGLLPGLNPNGQVLLLAALGDRGDSGALEAVASLMTSSDEQVVLAAIVAAGQLGNSGTVPGLAERAARSKGAARTAARNSLDRLRDKGTAVEEALVQVLKATAEAGIRAEAARSLAARGHRPAAAALIETARDADAELRIESLKSLSVLGQAGELSALVGLVCAPVAESDRAEAEKTLVTVARSVPAEAGKVTSLLAAFSAVAGDVPAKCSLLQSAGQIADPAALPILRASLKDNAPEVRAAAIRGLTEWNNAEPAQDLLVVARSALDESEKILAVRGFVRLVGLPCDRAGLDTLGLYAEAMKTARGVEEKKTVLGGMALVAHPGALADVMAYLKDSQLSVEAAAAAVQAANHIGLVCPDETRVAMGQVMAAFPGTPIAVGAERAVARLDATKDYVMAWQVAGPYMDEDKRFRELLDTVFAPEDSNATGIVWKIMPGTPQSDKPWLLDFRPLMDGIKRVAYLRTKVFSPVAQEAEIVCGSDDAMRVWLNATVVHTLNKGRACNPESDKVKVSLVEGWNTLLVKVANDDDQWETCLRIRSTSGAPIEGLKVSLE
jgi:HEAT repeat protein